MNTKHIKQAQKLIEMAESYESFFYKLQEENYGQLADIVRRLTLVYPLKKLWVTEATYGILVKAIVIDPEYREQGIGTKVMQAIIDYSDLTGKPLALTPSRQYGGTVSRLTDWYKGLGFEMNKGKKRDVRLPETMVRYPKKIGVREN